MTDLLVSKIAYGPHSIILRHLPIPAMTSILVTPLARKPSSLSWISLHFRCSARRRHTRIRAEDSSLPGTVPMISDHPSTTDVTLLGRLRDDPTDQAAWGDFVARYGPQILRWCRRRNSRRPTPRTCS
jgi:hypothetical protein